MLYFTQLIYIKQGQQEVFHQFEDVALPLIAKYNGRLLLRVRPGADAFIESTIEQPYEIHLVEFDAQDDFNNFMRDEERKQFLHLKEQSIQSAWLIKGERLA
jgi:uncharacterized protein (DUF1330 family)